MPRWRCVPQHNANPARHHRVQQDKNVTTNSQSILMGTPTSLRLPLMKRLSDEVLGPPVGAVRNRVAISIEVTRWNSVCPKGRTVLGEGSRQRDGEGAWPQREGEHPGRVSFHQAVAKAHVRRCCGLTEVQ